MLNQLTLTNFRQFEDKTVVFGPGNTSLRGANEGGKSTVIEGFLYVLGGAKACRNNDFCRWGAKPASCKVEALMTLQGTQIRATRGKSGAEIYVPHDAAAPTVTGQNEVTNWFAEQMGASLDVVKKMNFAGQKEIGGLLDDAPGKAVEFIEDLSGLAVVEFFVTRIQATGKVGATTALVERSNADRAQLESQSGISYAQNIAECEAAIEPLKTEKLEIDNGIGLDEVALSVDRLASLALTTYAANLSNAQRRCGRARDDISETTSALEKAETALEAARVESVIEADLEAAQGRQRDADDLTARRKAKAAADAWPTPESEWDEGVDSLQKFITSNREVERHITTQISETHAQISRLRQRRAVSESQKVTSSACGLCGKDVSEFPGVKEKNAALDADILSLSDEIAKLVVRDAELQAARGAAAEDADAGDAILKTPSFHLALSRPDLFETDGSYVPFRFKWIGGDIPAVGLDESDTIATLKAERLARVNLDKARASAATAASSARVALDTATRELQTLQEQTPAEDEESVRARIATREQSLTEKRLRAFKLAEELGSKRSLLKSLKQSEATHADLVQRLADALEKTETELALYEFHNRLIEDLRKARPVVANHLWNTILISVSTYLSRMRGEPSIVTREGKSFLVNGKMASSYSGSATDLLALGIRVALAKIFVPGALTLVLDEPFAACDAERTLQCLSFASAAGFEQTIVITHEDATEGVFQNIVEV